MTRVVLLTEIPAPFRIPLFEALAASEGIELRVLFLAAHDRPRGGPPRSYGLDRADMAFPHAVLRGRDLVLGERWLRVSRGLRGELAGFDPHVVLVGGWNQPAFWHAAVWARRKRRPLVVWVESTQRDLRRASLTAARVKGAVLAGAAAVLVPGRASAAYVAALGVPPERIATAPNAVDLHLFGKRVAELRDRREPLRAELGLDGCCAFVPARLSREKGVDVAVRAAGRVAGLTLALAGDGPERSALASLAEREAPGRVRFLGTLGSEDLARWYAAADVLVLPSRSEAWGMTLNEGAAAGLPLVASEAAGAAHDLVEEGRNGFRVPPEDVEALAARLAELAADSDLRARLGARSLELGRGFAPEAWAHAVAALARRLA